jgi:hypothetical protein
VLEKEIRVWEATFLKIAICQTEPVVQLDFIVLEELVKPATSETPVTQLTLAILQLVDPQCLDVSTILADINIMPEKLVLTTAIVLMDLCATILVKE